ncbi:MAG: NADP-dependent oxidoreductase [Candidatus Obscuribacterales bacterium]|nr:NADP-dependent oxidoreductase [Candidatus Obscuribacterales bacterium]
MTAVTKERINRQFKLKTRPTGRVNDSNFDFVEEPVPPLQKDQALVRNLYLSLDPTNRVWMTDVPQYMPPVGIGEVMRGGGVGQVIESKNSKYKVGDFVSGLIGWQDYLLITGNEKMPPQVLPKGLPIPLTAMLGPCGTTGLTAYFGLLEIGQPKTGETVVVSAAAGAVGSIVGQIAKIKGCRVVGIAGTDEKCKWLTSELGFDAAVNYKNADWKEQLKAACPNGIDISFENVGGEIMNYIISKLNLKARIVLCGLISGYNDGDVTKSQISLTPILIKRARIEGFIILDYAARFKEGAMQLGQWVFQKKIKYKETIVEGLEKAPEALNQLFDGDNTGKLMIKISDPVN